MNQTIPLMCVRHPNDAVVVISVAEECEYPSRLACFKCVKEYKDVDKFVDFQRFRVDVEDIIKVVGQYGNDFTSEVHYYYNVLGKGLIQTQFTFMNHLIRLLESVKQAIREIIGQYSNYYQRMQELKGIYFSKLNVINAELNKLVNVYNYHSSQEWVTLSQSLTTYVKTFYNDQDSDVKLAISKMRKPGLEMLQSQPKFQEVCDQIVTELNNVKSYYENEACFTNISTQLLPKGFHKTLESKISNKPRFKLLYQGADGMSSTMFWSKCNNQGPTLVICKSKSGVVFGGYSPCKWIANNGYQVDNSRKSFLFSATKKQIYKLINPDFAIYGGSTFGPTFGGGHDLNIAGNFQAGMSSVSNYYYSTDGYHVEDTKTHLMGATEPQLADIEVYLAY